MTPIRIALLGTGTVGGGLLRVLARNQEEIRRRAGRGIVVARVGARDVAKARRVVGDGIPIDADLLGRGRPIRRSRSSSS